MLRRKGGREKRTVLSDFNSLIANCTSFSSNNSVTASIHAVAVIGINILSTKFLKKFTR